MTRAADAIAEGVAIATAAARLAIKNRILVHTIAADGAFTADEYAADARAVLDELAGESERAAEMTVAMRKRARGRFSEPSGTHDYRDRDVRNLRRREKQARGVAQKLRDMAADEKAVLELVNVAREAAWADVRGNLDRRLRVEGMRADQDPDYDTLREARMQALRLVDLQALAAQARARRKTAAQKPGTND